MAHLIKCKGIIKSIHVFENPKADQNSLFRKYVFLSHLANDLYL